MNKNNSKNCYIPSTGQPTINTSILVFFTAQTNYLIILNLVLLCKFLKTFLMLPESLVLLTYLYVVFENEAHKRYCFINTALRLCGSYDCT